MNFEKWLNSEIKYFDKTIADTLEMGWNACKNEALKIVTDKNNYIYNDDINNLIIEEIEKL